MKMFPVIREMENPQASAGAMGEIALAFAPYDAPIRREK